MWWKPSAAKLFRLSVSYSPSQSLSPWQSSEEEEDNVHSVSGQGRGHGQGCGRVCGRGRGDHSRGCSRGHGRRHSTASTAQTVNTMLDTTLPTLDIPDTAVVMSFPFTSPREPGSYVRNNSGTTHTPLEFFSMIELLMLWKQEVWSHSMMNLTCLLTTLHRKILLGSLERLHFHWFSSIFVTFHSFTYSKLEFTSC